MAEVDQSPQGTVEQPLPMGARCLNCRYLLDGLPHRVCPECGQVFDPACRGTYFRPGQPAWHKSLCRWAAPPGLWHAVVSVAVLAWLNETLWGEIIQGAERDHQDNSATLSMLTWLGLGLAFTYITRALAVNAWGVIRRRPARWRAWLGWGTFPVCALLAVPAAGVPVRFVASSPMLLLKAQEVINQGRSDYTPQRIGLYRFRRVTVGPGDEVRFDFAESRWEVSSILYSRDPPNHICRRLVRLAAHWYAISW